MDYKLVIFDCDGVLVDSEAIGNRFISEALTLAGIPISAEGALSQFLGGKLTQIKEDAEKQLGFSLPSNWVDEIYKIVLSICGSVRDIRDTFYQCENSLDPWTDLIKQHFTLRNID